MEDETQEYIKEKTKGLLLSEFKEVERFMEENRKPDAFANEIKRMSQVLLRGNLLCMSEDLGKAMLEGEKDSDIEKLNKQTQLLDQIMLRMLSTADYNIHTNLKQYALALRAQNQSRNTIMARAALKHYKAIQHKKGKQIETNSTPRHTPQLAKLLAKKSKNLRNSTTKLYKTETIEKKDAPMDRRSTPKTT